MGPPVLTPIAVALDGVTALGVDTAPLIYFVEQHPVYAPRVRVIFERIATGQIQGFSSMITLTEVLTRPREAGDAELAPSPAAQPSGTLVGQRVNSPP
jgi:hypothetical protein